ncbi:MAG: hypothetical protein K2P39_10800, partial [Lachnospiraceae bacterium]|nr:hypothetical protein [Lachnospiraceae bacterium]
LCTLAAVEAEGTVERAETFGVQGSLSVDAPCSKVKGLIEALTTSGSGNYSAGRKCSRSVCAG